MAERVGFEPTNGEVPITRFPIVLLRPTRTPFPKRLPYTLLRPPRLYYVTQNADMSSRLKLTADLWYTLPTEIPKSSPAWTCLRVLSLCRGVAVVDERRGRTQHEGATICQFSL